MKKIAIEDAKLSDVPALVKIEKICFSSDRLRPYEFRRLIKRPEAWVQVVRLDHELLGNIIAIRRKNTRVARLYSLAVLPEHRNKNIAEKLYLHLEANLAEQCHTVKLEVNTANKAAQKFYIKHGYQIVGERTGFYDDGSDAICMLKHLNEMQLK